MTFFSNKITKHSNTTIGNALLKATSNMYQETLKTTTLSDVLRSGITIEKEYSTEVEAQA